MRASPGLKPISSEFIRCILLNPRKAELYLFRANVHQNFRNYEQAIADNRMIFKYKHTANEESLALNNLGFIYNSTGRHNDSIKETTNAILLDKNDEVAYNNRGFALQSIGRSQEAILDYLRATEIDPDYAIGIQVSCP